MYTNAAASASSPIKPPKTIAIHFNAFFMIPFLLARHLVQR
jgi:hypothetical protein